MRVLAHVHKYPPEHNAGAEYMLAAILEDLVARGHEAEVYGADLKADHDVNGIRAHRKSSGRSLDRLYAGADLIVTHLDETPRAIARARAHGLPVVHLVHNHQQVTANKLTPATADLLVANTEWIAATFPAWARAVTVYPPVDVDRYTTTPGGMVTLLNLAPAKGGPLFFKLAAALPDVDFLGVRGAYASQAVPKVIPRNVEVIPNTPSVVDEVYARTAVLLVPSSYESFGRVAIEAGASGIPVIAHPTEGLVEALGDAGIFIDRDRPKEWERAIRRLLDDESYRAERGAAMRARAEELAATTAGQLDRLAAELEDLVAVCDRRLIDFAASAPGYLDHLAPVWHELPEDRRGTFYVAEWLTGHAEALDVDPEALAPFAEDLVRFPGTGPLVVASSTDQVRGLLRPVIMLEHGAGQSYGNRHQSYAGGAGRKNVTAVAVPGPTPAARYARYYPRLPVVEVGCPKLDPWLTGERSGPAPDAPPVVALSFHWRCTVSPEAGTVVDGWLDYFARIRADLDAQGVTLLGHGHPGIFDELQPHYERAGIEPVATFDEVLERAHVYAVDNSSTLYEFAATGRPVIVLNGPPYRRTVNVGLRFWTEADVGINVEGPLDFAAAVAEALTDPPDVARSREEAVARVYSVLDGTSSRRTARMIIDSVAGRGITNKPRASGGGSVRRGKNYRGPLRRYPNPAGRGFLMLTEEHARDLGIADDDGAEETTAEPPLHKKRPAPTAGGTRRRKKEDPPEPAEAVDAEAQADEIEG